MIRIPVYQPRLEGNEKLYVIECLDSNWISSKGRFIAEFEHSFAGYVGIQNAVSVCNGTVALHLALLALGIGPGDEVIVPTLTYVASVNAIAYVGATPVFVDSLAETWQMAPVDVRRKITPRTRAIMAVHLYGHPCDMAEICSIAEAHDLAVVEDAAEAFGTLYGGRHVGGFGKIATFSFFGNKTITCGEGGMVVTNDPDLAGRARHLRSQGVDPTRTYWHDVIGYNYRMTNIAAAIGLGQLENADRVLREKARLARWYDEALAEIPITRHSPVGNAGHSYWMYSILVPHDSDRDSVMVSLAEDGIETRPVFYPAHTLPMYAKPEESYAVAEDLGRRGINLPSWPGLQRDDVEFIAESLERALKK